MALAKLHSVATSLAVSKLHYFNFEQSDKLKSGREVNMHKFMEALTALLKVKTLVTMAVMLVFTVLSLKGVITAENAMIVISMVVSFYFGTQHEKTQNT